MGSQNGRLECQTLDARWARTVWPDGSAASRDRPRLARRDRMASISFQ